MPFRLFSPEVGVCSLIDPAHAIDASSIPHNPNRPSLGSLHRKTLPRELIAHFPGPRVSTILFRLLEYAKCTLKFSVNHKLRSIPGRMVCQSEATSGHTVYLIT